MSDIAQVTNLLYEMGMVPADRIRDVINLAMTTEEIVRNRTGNTGDKLCRLAFYGSPGRLKTSLYEGEVRETGDLLSLYEEVDGTESIRIEKEMQDWQELFAQLGIPELHLIYLVLLMIDTGMIDKTLYENRKSKQRELFRDSEKAQIPPELAQAGWDAYVRIIENNHTLRVVRRSFVARTN